MPLPAIAQKLRNRLALPDDLLLPLPCLPVFWFFVAASIPVSLPAFGYASVPVAAAIGGAMIGVAFLTLPHKSWKYAWAMLPAALITIAHAWAPWQTYVKHLNAAEASGEIRGVVTEVRLPVTDSLQWLEQPRQVELKLTHMMHDGEWQRRRGKLLLRDGPEDIRYGDHITATGAFRLPWRSALPGTMNYANYLRGRGITHIFRAYDADVNSGATGWRRGLAAFYSVRDYAAAQIVEGIDKPEDRTVLAAMTCGFRQGMTPEDRNLYLRSGMLHLFAISGLHVGILFTILMLLLSLLRVPFSIKYFLAPVLLFLYVIATGAAPSAIRAWVMLTAWSAGRGLKFPMVTTNFVLFAAVAMLVLNPFHLYHSGYQFSFIIVLALIWGWRRGQFIVNYLFERKHWIPIRAQNPNHIWDRTRIILLKSFISMSAAWLGGLGLTAFYNNLFLPAGIPTNMAVCAIAWLIIFLSVVKLVFAALFLGWFATGIGWLLEWPLLLLRTLADISANGVGVITVATPPLLLMFVYYLVLFAFLLIIPQLRRSFVMGIILIAVTLALCGRYRLYDQHPPVTVLVPDSSIHPVLLVCVPGREPLLINTGSKRFAFRLSSWLRHQGIDRLDGLLLLDNRALHLGGTEQLLQSVQARTLLVHARDKHNLVPILDRQMRAGGCRRIYDREHPLRWQGVSLEKLIDGTEEYLCKLRTREWTLAIALTIKPRQESTLSLTRTFEDKRIESTSWTYFFSSEEILKEWDGKVVGPAGLEPATSRL